MGTISERKGMQPEPKIRALAHFKMLSVANCQNVILTSTNAFQFLLQNIPVFLLFAP